MNKSQPQPKSEKRELLARKIKIKQNKGATLAGQLLRFKTVQKYKGKKNEQPLTCHP